MSSTVSFADNLRAARARLKLNQTDLGRQVGIGQGAITKWETGKSTPTVDQLLVIAHALGTTAADLLAGLTLPPKEPPAPGRAKAPTRTRASKRISPLQNNPDGPPLITRRPGRQPPVEVA